MAHEKSITVRHPSVPGRAGGWVNIDTVGTDAGKILGGRSYKTRKAAVAAVKKRSAQYRTDQRGKDSKKYKSINLKPNRTKRKKG